MDKALVFGTKDCRFESCQGHGPGESERKNATTERADAPEWARPASKPKDSVTEWLR